MISKLMYIAFLAGVLSGCASTPRTNTELSGSSDKRVPASQTQLSYTAGQIYAALQAIEQQPGLWFSKIQTVRILSPLLVEIEVVDDDGKVNALRLKTFETKCGSSDCPLEAEIVR